MLGNFSRERNKNLLPFHQWDLLDPLGLLDQGDPLEQIKIKGS